MPSRPLAAQVPSGWSGPVLILGLLTAGSLVGCEAVSLDGDTAGKRGASSPDAAASGGPSSSATPPTGGAAGAPPPSTTEVCDGVDNDGDGEIDEADAGCVDSRDCAQEAHADSSVTATTSTHAIWLPGIQGELRFMDDARLVQNPDGTAQLTGTLAPEGRYDKGFAVDLHFGAHSLTPGSGMPVMELYPSEYAPYGSVDPSSWYYYGAFSGTLTGFGSWAGAEVDIQDSGMGAQVGDGANGRNLEHGLSGWLDWNLVSAPWDGSLSWDSSGHGDINIVIDGCSACVDVDLGAAADHNLFVFENYRYGVDVEGAVAAGNLVDMSGFSVGRAVGSGPVLSSGNRVELSSGTVHGQVEYVNPSASTISSDVTINGGDPVVGSTIDFATEQAALETLSDDLGALLPTGRTEVTPWGELRLTGDDSAVNVFFIEGTDFVAATFLQIDVPSGSTVLINVDGTILNTSNFYFDLQGAGETEVLWNFPEATWLGLQSIGVRGSVLAPYATVDFDNGSFDGTFVALTFLGNAEGHSYPWSGAGTVCE